jgi:DNA-binding response OmpR family regulator
MQFGPLLLNLRGFSVSVEGRDVPLTYAEFLLLMTLARDPYSVIGREPLMRVLSEASLGRKSLAVSLRAVDTHIARIRKKLADAGCDCIRTMRNVGYRFVPPEGCSA